MKNIDPRDLILKSPMSRMQMAVVVITIALNALDGYDVLSISIAAGSIRDQLGIAPSLTGLLLSMELIGMAIGSIFLGRFADAWGRRPMMLFCLAMMSLGMYMVTTAPGFLAGILHPAVTAIPWFNFSEWPVDLVHISIWRIITGLGIGGLLASINACVAEYSNKPKRHMNVSLMSIGYPVGAFTGGFIAAELLQSYTWHSVFVLGCGMTLALIPIVYFFVPETVSWQVRNQKPGALEKVNATLAKMGHAPVEALPDVRAELAEASHNSIFTPSLVRTTAIVTAAYFFHIMTFYFILKWTGVIVEDRGFDPSNATRVLSWINVGGATGGALLGFLTLRYDLKRLTIGSMIISTGLVAVYGSVGSDLVQMTLICIASGFFINAAINGMYAIFAHAYPTQVRAAGTGFAIGVGRGGSILAPIAAGIMFEGGIGVPFVAVVMGCGSLLAAVALSFLKLRVEPPEGIEAESAGAAPPKLTESAARV
jgi:MFS transporter, AAHS family, vanillate permease